MAAGFASVALTRQSRWRSTARPAVQPVRHAAQAQVIKAVRVVYVLELLTAKRGVPLALPALNMERLLRTQRNLIVSSQCLELRAGRLPKGPGSFWRWRSTPR
jgi:hypothetical protein